MHSQTQSHAAFADTLQAKLGELVERATVAAPGAERSRLLRWLLVAAAVFLVWRMARGARKLLWTLFGIAMALYWSGAWALLR
jgi:hypothetical protein